MIAYIELEMHHPTNTPQKTKINIDALIKSLRLRRGGGMKLLLADLHITTIMRSNRFVDIVLQHIQDAVRRLSVDLDGRGDLAQRNLAQLLHRKPSHTPF